MLMEGSILDDLKYNGLYLSPITIDSLSYDQFQSYVTSKSAKKKLEVHS